MNEKKFLMCPIQCNILLIGKTGVGKSSFANYLFGEKLFTTGNGKPVTEWENNFQHYGFNFNGDDNIRVNVYDSVGLEPNNFDKWRRALDDFLFNYPRKESTRNSHFFCEGMTKSREQILPANEIIHAFFYIVNAASARIEDNEFGIIDSVYKKHKISSAIVLSNCDTVKITDLEKLEDEIRKKYENMNILRVCSISKKTRGGEKIAPYGRNEAIKHILLSSYEKVGQDLTIAMYENLISQIKGTKQKIKQLIDDIKPVDIVSNEYVKVSLLKEKMDEIMDKSFAMFRTFVYEDYKSYYNFLNSFKILEINKMVNASHKWFDFNQDQVMSDIRKKMTKENENMKKNMDGMISKMDHYYVLKMITFGVVATEFITWPKKMMNIFGIKRKLKEQIDISFNPIIQEVQKELEEIKNE